MKASDMEASVMGTADPIGRPLGAWVHRRAEVFPDSPALSFGGKTLSYAAFAERIDRLAAGLHRALALEAGERIAYLGQNHADLLTLVFAAARQGLIVVPLNWRLAPPEHRAILADARPAAVLVAAPFADQADELLRQGGPWRPIALDFMRDGWLGFEEFLQADRAVPAIGGDGDPLLIVYTSGTTGLAKGAVLTQDALCWNAANSVDLHDLGREDRILNALPLFHVGGLNIQTMPALAVGAEVRLEARFDPGTFLEIIARDQPTLTVLDQVSSFELKRLTKEFTR
jgi:fatty-acyl-CoA synthase